MIVIHTRSTTASPGVQVSSFEVASDAFTTFKRMMQDHPDVVAKYLDANYDMFWTQYNTLLQSENYVTRRQVCAPCPAMHAHYLSSSSLPCTHPQWLCHCGNAIGRGTCAEGSAACLAMQCMPQSVHRRLACTSTPLLSPCCALLVMITDLPSDLGTWPWSSLSEFAWNAIRMHPHLLYVLGRECLRCCAGNADAACFALLCLRFQ